MFFCQCFGFPSQPIKARAPVEAATVARSAVELLCGAVSSCSGPGSGCVSAFAIPWSMFRAAFRRWTGGSATGYISCLRIRRARILLGQRDLPIGEIALQLGYFDACHFSRAFRARTGLSPRQYRARL